jgi:hypothetical protein
LGFGGCLGDCGGFWGNPSYVGWVPPQYNGGSQCTDDGSGNGVLCIAANTDCKNAQAMNTSANNQPGHNNMISNIFQIDGQFAGNILPIGYEYQTYGRQEYFQPFITIGTGLDAGVNAGFASIGISISISTSANPIIPFHGSVWSALVSFMNATNTSQSSLPSPYPGMTSQTGVSRMECTQAVGSSLG